MPFTIAFVAGVTLTKWTRAWEERRPDLPLAVLPVTEGRQFAILGVVPGDIRGAAEVDAGGSRRADVSFVRLRDDMEADTSGLSVIRLYQESPVALLPKEHPLVPEAGAALTLAALAGELITPADDSPEALRHAVELVAAGGGALIMPQSVARLHGRKDVVAIDVTDAPVTNIALCWQSAATSFDIDQFVGIVRGRTANSSRQPPATTAGKKQERSARSAARGASRPAKSGGTRARRARRGR